MKESWKAINELLNKRSKSSNIDFLREPGSETVHKKDISNAMNSFFCSVGKDPADKIDPAPIPFLLVTMKLTNTRQHSASGLLKCRRSGIHLPPLRLQRALGLTIPLAPF